MTVSSEKISKENYNISNLQSFNYSSINNNMEEEENYNNYDDNIGKKALTKLKYEYYKNMDNLNKIKITKNNNNFGNDIKDNIIDKELLEKRRQQNEIIQEIVNKYKYPVTYKFNDESEKTISNNNSIQLNTINKIVKPDNNNNKHNKNNININFCNNNNKIQNSNKPQKQYINQSSKNMNNINQIKNNNLNINNNPYLYLEKNIKYINNVQQNNLVNNEKKLSQQVSNNNKNNLFYLEDEDNLADKIKPISLKDLDLMENDKEKINKLYLYGQENNQYLKRLQLKYNILKEQFNQLIKIKKNDMNLNLNTNNDNISIDDRQCKNDEFKEYLLKENNILKNQIQNSEEIIIYLINYINDINDLFNNKKIDVLKIKQIIKDYNYNNNNIEKSPFKNINNFLNNCKNKINKRLNIDYDLKIKDNQKNFIYNNDISLFNNKNELELDNNLYNFQNNEKFKKIRDKKVNLSTKIKVKESIRNIFQKKNFTKLENDNIQNKSNRNKIPNKNNMKKKIMKTTPINKKKRKYDSYTYNNNISKKDNYIINRSNLTEFREVYLDNNNSNFENNYTYD